VRRRLARAPRHGYGRSVLVAGIVAVAVALAVDATQLMTSLEQDTVGVRFQLRGEQDVAGIAVVAVDDVTFSDLERQWPFKRSLHAKAVDALRRAGAREIVYDVQFTEPTKPEEDGALYDAIGRAGGAVLATTETDGHGRTKVLGGDDNLAAIGAVAGAANLVTDARDIVHRFPYASGGLDSLAVVAARRAGRPLDRSAFEAAGAWIDYRGPAGTIPTVSFSDLVRGRADTDLLRDRIVVVGATAPTLQDVHATPTSPDRLMSGPEIQANAIWTALHGLPLRSAPRLLGWLAILVLGLLPALATMRGRAAGAALAAPLLAFSYLLLVHAAFGSGLVLPVTYPVLALLLGTVSAIAAAYVAEREQRRRVGFYNERLEAEVHARTEELRETQLEIVRRLGRAVELRDADTGVHIDRMSTLSGRLALAAGLSPAEADLLQHAAVLHDVGKVGIPDHILLKPGPLEPGERTVMETHTTVGAELLAGSRSPLVQLAEQIARSHHERWDGTGYPHGLRGDAIPLAARICAICDVFDALLSARPYKAPWTLEQTLAELGTQRGRHFDPELVDQFLALVGELEPALLAPGGTAPEVGVLDLTEPVAVPVSPVV
jgi:CHASE2 domain-containing sensor protein